jgi:hypothetical protein
MNQNKPQHHSDDGDSAAVATQRVVTVRMTSVFHEGLKTAADMAGLSMNQFCLNALETAIWDLQCSLTTKGSDDEAVNQKR